MNTKKKRKSPWVHDPDKIVAAERVLRQSKGLLRNPTASCGWCRKARPFGSHAGPTWA